MQVNRCTLALSDISTLMDKLSFNVGDGGRKLPPGFRFQPTDEEIVFLYLSRKIFSHPLPALLIIPEINIFSFDPWELPGNSDQVDMYFFSKKEGKHDQSGNYRTGSGYWKAITGSTKRIICTKRMPIVGIRKSLVFHKLGKQSRGHAFKTDWIMHEYCIALSENTDSNINIPHKKNSQGSLVRIGDWTLCHIFLKETSTIAEADHDNTYKPSSDDFVTADYMSDTDSSSASSSSPHCDSSVCNEVSSNTANGSEN